MASITIRMIPPELKERIRLRAARHGRSMEKELREIIRATIAAEENVVFTNLADAIHSRFKKLGGLELPTTEREAVRPPPSFK